MNSLIENYDSHRKARHLKNHAPGARHERGTALVMSLVFLLILTLLGITAMGTSSLQQKMSGNTQEVTRALEAAESGVIAAVKTPNSLVLSGQVWNNNNTPFTFGSVGLSVVTASVSVGFVDYSPPKRGSGFDNSFSAANFDANSSGKTLANAKATVHQGIAQIVPAP